MDLRARNNNQQSGSKEKQTAASKRKRNSSSKIAPNAKRLKNDGQENRTPPIPGLGSREVDSYCWLCHKNGFEVICTKCPRVFHKKCTKKNSLSSICQDCLTRREDEASDRMKELMIYLLDSTFSLPKLKDLFLKWPEDDNNSKLHPRQIIDKETLVERVQKNHYGNASELYSDFKWIIHNSYIVWQETSAENISLAKELLKRFDEELLLLNLCSDCFYFKYSEEFTEENYFINICSKPHLIVYAKLKGFSHWPAKVLNIRKDRSAQVMFFGTHNIATVDSKSWFPFMPGEEDHLSPNKMQFCSAIQEMICYNNNVEGISKEKTGHVRNNIESFNIKSEFASTSDLPDSVNSGHEEEEISSTTTSQTCTTAKPCCSSSEKSEQLMSRMNSLLECLNRYLDITNGGVAQPPPQPKATEVPQVSMVFSTDPKDTNEASIEDLLRIPRPSVIPNPATVPNDETHQEIQQVPIEVPSKSNVPLIDLVKEDPDVDDDCTIVKEIKNKSKTVSEEAKYFEQKGKELYDSLITPIVQALQQALPAAFKATETMNEAVKLEKEKEKKKNDQEGIVLDLIDSLLNKVNSDIAAEENS